MGLGEPGDVVAERMRYRYYAKLEFVRAQARQMIRKTLHNRTRKLNPKLVIWFSFGEITNIRGTVRKQVAWSWVHCWCSGL